MPRDKVDPYMSLLGGQARVGESTIGRTSGLDENGYPFDKKSTKKFANMEIPWFQRMVIQICKMD